jgi:NAD(P)-dependent dehydrogenase (short-subunit alcohol dehydrogenase family)
MLREMLTINLEAPFLLCRAMVPSMRERGWGRIVNISTGALWTSLGGFVDYLMSKGALWD